MPTEAQPSLSASASSRGNVRFGPERLKQFHTLLACGAAVTYLIVTTAWSLRPLWYDELFTYYIAKSATLHQFLTNLSAIDLNPPLHAALTVAVFRLLGDGNFAARLPSMAAFAMASLFLYQFAARRLGNFAGLAAVLALWSTDFLRYASEARPYALVVFFLGLAMVNWQRAVDGTSRRRGLAGIAAGVGGMLMSHVFGSIVLLALGAAELYRSYRVRAVDWGIWAAFFAPTPLLVFYAPMVLAHHKAAVIYPRAFQASLSKAIAFFPDMLGTGAFALLLSVMAALMVASRAVESSPESPREAGLTSAERVLCAGLLTAPLVVNLLLLRAGAAFWPRYAIGASFGASLLFAEAVLRASGRSRVATVAAAAVLLAGVMLTRIVLPAAAPEALYLTRKVTIQDLDSTLPVVPASGVVFLEMDHREADAITSRLYYLTDEKAARQYSHATLFETFPALQQAFPIRAHVTPYAAFTGRTRHFLVLCTLNFPEDWLVAKLLADGAQLQFIGQLGIDHRDALVFDVKMGGQ